jgi:predicted RNA binding protein YcfA (HicA-like mRNA interferase family)/energy-coupling factor transporter ATP-binding protein EcfA2
MTADHGPASAEPGDSGNFPDLADIPGDDTSRRALEVALAGGHHVLLVGPAGSGKTGLLRCLPGLLPPLTAEEAAEVDAIHRRAGKPRAERSEPPIRMPHPESTARGFLGFGRRPGELELAHRGVLALDHLPAFRREILRALRQPIEEGVLRLARKGQRGERPAAVLLLATMRSCPCGGGNERERQCPCGRGSVERHWRRVREELGSLFDVQIELGRPNPGCEGSAEVRRRIREARRIQRERFGNGRPRAWNGAMSSEDLRLHCALDRAVEALPRSGDREAPALFRHLRARPGGGAHRGRPRGERRDPSGPPGRGAGIPLAPSCSAAGSIVRPDRAGRLRAMTAAVLVAALTRAEFRATRQRGSHLTLIHPDGRRATVPVHRAPLKLGTLRAILRKAGMRPADLDPFL